MRGPPGCGKTHLAEELREYSTRNGDRQPAILSTDRFFTTPSGRYAFDHTRLDEFHKKNLFDARAAMENNQSPVIIDNTNMQLAHMKPYINLTIKSCYEIYVIDPATPWRNDVRTLAMKNKHGVDAGGIISMLSSFEPIVCFADLLKPTALVIRELVHQRDGDGHSEQQGAKRDETVEESENEEEDDEGEDEDSEENESGEESVSEDEDEEESQDSRDESDEEDESGDENEEEDEEEEESENGEEKRKSRSHKHMQCFDGLAPISDIKKCIEHDHSVLIIMRGPPGCGKTHLAKELRSYSTLNCGRQPVILSTDRFFTKPNGRYAYDHTRLDEFHKKNQIEARAAMENNQSPVIIDNTNMQLADMKPYIDLAIKSCYEIYVIDPAPPWRNDVRALATRNQHAVDAVGIRSMLSSFEPIVCFADLLKPTALVMRETEDQREGNCSSDKQSAERDAAEREDGEVDERLSRLVMEKQCFDFLAPLSDIKKCIKHGHSVLILMRGPPGCGKTHIAEELLAYSTLHGGNTRQPVILSPDRFFTAPNDRKYFNLKKQVEFYKKNLIDALDAMKNNQSPVIIDDTNILLAQMKAYIWDAIPCGYEIYVIEPATPWRNDAQQLATKNHRGVDEAAIRHILNQFEPIKSFKDIIQDFYRVKSPLMRWKKVTNTAGPFPSPYSINKTVSIKDLMIVLGRLFDHGPMDKLHAYNTATNQWSVLQLRGDIPSFRAMFGISAVNDIIYVHGGRSESQHISSDLLELNGQRWEWKKLRPKSAGKSGMEPCARFGHSFTVTPDQVAYVFGGVMNGSPDPNDYEPFLLNDLYSIDLKAKYNALQWEAPQTFGAPPSPRSSHSCAYVETGTAKQLVIYGGIGGNKRHFWLLNVESMTWDKPVMNSLPPSVGGHFAGMIGDRMIVLGGDQVVKTVEKAGRGRSTRKTKQMVLEYIPVLACLNVNTHTWEKVNLESGEFKPFVNEGLYAVVINSKLFCIPGRSPYDDNTDPQPPPSLAPERIPLTMKSIENLFEDFSLNEQDEIEKQEPLNADQPVKKAEARSGRQYATTAATRAQRGLLKKGEAATIPPFQKRPKRDFGVIKKLKHADHPVKEAENAIDEQKVWAKAVEEVLNKQKKERDEKHREIFKHAFPNDIKDPAVAKSRSGRLYVSARVPCGSPEDERIGEAATIPPCQKTSKRDFGQGLNETNLIENCLEEHKRRVSTVHKEWKVKERIVFKRSWQGFPKNFAAIAEHLPNKTTRQCVQFYYMTKKDEEGARASVYKEFKHKGRRRKIPKMPTMSEVAATLAKVELESFDSDDGGKEEDNEVRKTTRMPPNMRNIESSQSSDSSDSSNESELDVEGISEDEAEKIKNQ